MSSAYPSSSCRPNTSCGRPSTACSAASSSCSKASTMTLSSIPSISLASSCNSADYRTLLQRRQQIYAQVEKIQGQLAPYEGHGMATSIGVGDRRAKSASVPTASLRARQAELQFQMRNATRHSDLRLNEQALRQLLKAKHSLPATSQGATAQDVAVPKAPPSQEASQYVLVRPAQRTATVGSLEPGRYAFWPKSLPGAALSRRGPGQGARRQNT
mmetsp:Transcript_16158/g.34693  ORF Transcript_16158/g.34693 Transcript_16158/m.34693 type:complete len:215 (+) Transcript_16158:318-962(+)